MNAEAYLNHLRADAARLADVATRGLDKTIPACPGWTVRDVLVHTGELYSNKAATVRLGARPTEWDRGPGDGRDPVEWYRQRFAELEHELTVRDPGDPAHTWHEDHRTVAFWIRRMTHETAVHRVDVESGHDAVTPIPDELAVDGIDEVLDWYLVRWHEEVGPDAPGRGTVAIRTGAHVWRVELTADTATLHRGPGAADATVTGEPSELLLWLWGRRPDTAVSREGDEGLLRGFRARMHAVTSQ